MVAQTYYPNSQEAEVSESWWFWGQSGLLHREILINILYRTLLIFHLLLYQPIKSYEHAWDFHVIQKVCKLRIEKSGLCGNAVLKVLVVRRLDRIFFFLQVNDSCLVTEIAENEKSHWLHGCFLKLASALICKLFDM